MLCNFKKKIFFFLTLLINLNWIIFCKWILIESYFANDTIFFSALASSPEVYDEWRRMERFCSEIKEPSWKHQVSLFTLAEISNMRFEIQRGKGFFAHACTIPLLSLHCSGPLSRKYCSSSHKNSHLTTSFHHITIFLKSVYFF